MRSMQVGEEAQALIDAVLEEAKEHAQELSYAQQKLLRQLAAQYHHLGDNAVIVMCQALQDAALLSSEMQLHMRSNLERRTFGRSRDDESEVGFREDGSMEEPMVIPGKVTVIVEDDLSHHYSHADKDTEREANIKQKERE